MAMSKEDWAAVESRLLMSRYSVHLDCDGRILMLIRMPKREMSDCIRWYVNGKFDYSWLTTDCEDRRRFARPCKAYEFRKKFRDSMNDLRRTMKRIPKKYQAAFADANERCTIYSSYWTSFRALRRHLQKNNSEISILRDWNGLQGGDNGLDRAQREDA